MDAIDALLEMHKEAKQEFATLEQSQPGGRQALWQKLSPALKLHEQIEEQFVYDPASQQLPGEPAVTRWHETHEQQVGEATKLIQSLDAGDASTDEWMQIARNLKSALETHIQQEEGDFWPLLREKWGKQNLERPAEPIQAAKQALKRGAPVETAIDAGKQKAAA